MGDHFIKQLIITGEKNNQFSYI